ncbi:MAG: hypothetical protein ACT4PP_05380 [Sporichthyaceae bacterium]
MSAPAGYRTSVPGLPAWAVVALGWLGLVLLAALEFGVRSALAVLPLGLVPVLAAHRYRADRAFYARLRFAGAARGAGGDTQEALGAALGPHPVPTLAAIAGPKLEVVDAELPGGAHIAVAWDHSSGLMAFTARIEAGRWPDAARGLLGARGIVGAAVGPHPDAPSLPEVWMTVTVDPAAILDPALTKAIGSTSDGALDAVGAAIRVADTLAAGGGLRWVGPSSLASLIRSAHSAARSQRLPDLTLIRRCCGASVLRRLPAAALHGQPFDAAAPHSCPGRTSADPLPGLRAAVASE